MAKADNKEGKEEKPKSQVKAPVKGKPKAKASKKSRVTKPVKGTSKKKRVRKKKGKTKAEKIAEHTEQSKKNVLLALSLSLGVVTSACRKANVGRTQFYAWIEEDNAFAMDVNMVKEEALDLVESKLFQRINGLKTPDSHVSVIKGKVVVTELKKHYPPNVASIIFYLKTQGKKRGYVERQEVEINTKSDVAKMLENLDELSDKELETLAALTSKLDSTDGDSEA